MKSSRLNFLCLSAEPAFMSRCQQLATDFEYSFLGVKDATEILELEGKYDLIQFVLVDASQETKKEGLAQLVQTVKYVCSNSFMCVVAGKKIPADAVEFLKKSGANFVILDHEFHETSRLEFVASQIIRAAYVPTKVAEFPVNSVLDFTLYHLMPLNQKLLPVLPKGTPLTEGRIKKLEGVNELYVNRNEVDLYKQFVETHQDASAHGLKGRCRAQYLSFCNSHTQLIFNLIDQSEGASFKEGKWLYERCEMLAKDLLTTLSAVGEAWEVVNNSSIGEFGSVERSPAIAAYSGVMSLLSSIGDPVEVMVASLLADVGMLDLHPRITRKLRHSHGVEELNAEELAAYQRHPIMSLNRCFDKKLSVKDSIREMILCSHERVDMTGFPEKREAAKIPPAGMLIQFSEMIDKGSMVRMGQARASVQQVRRQILEHEIQDAKIFSFTFMQKLKPVL